MTNLLNANAQAYINFGRWVADCPMGCGNATALEFNQVTYYCAPPGGCGHIGEVTWPVDAPEIWGALEERPMPKTRNWFPRNHDLALKSGCPHGQTPAELREEARENGVM